MARALGVLVVTAAILWAGWRVSAEIRETREEALRAAYVLAVIEWSRVRRQP